MPMMIPTYEEITARPIVRQTELGGRPRAGLILEDYVVSGLTLFMPPRKQCEAYRRKKARTA